MNNCEAYIFTLLQTASKILIGHQQIKELLSLNASLIKKFEQYRFVKYLLKTLSTPQLTELSLSLMSELERISVEAYDRTNAIKDMIEKQRKEKEGEEEEEELITYRISGEGNLTEYERKNLIGFEINYDLLVGILEQMKFGERLRELELEISPYTLTPKDLANTSIILGIGKTGCLSKDTKIPVLIYNPVPEIQDVTLKEVYEKFQDKPFTVFSCNLSTGEIEPDKAIIIPSGKKLLYKIKLKSGKEVFATNEHKFFVYDNGDMKEVELKDLKVGDNLITVDKFGRAFKRCIKCGSVAFKPFKGQYCIKCVQELPELRNAWQSSRQRLSESLKQAMNRPEVKLKMEQNNYSKRRGKHKIKEVKVNCDFCHKAFLITEVDFRLRKKYNKYGIFCSQSCKQKYMTNVIGINPMNDEENRRKVGIGKQRHYREHPELLEHLSKLRKEQYKKFGGNLKWVLKGEKNPSKRPEVKLKISKALKGTTKTALPGDRNPSKKPEVRKKLREIALKRWHDPNDNRKFLKGENGILHDEKTKQRIGKGLSIKPNTLEKKVIDILESLGVFSKDITVYDKWKYVGDGKISIAGKKPDFVNQKDKKIIEVFGDIWHREEDVVARKNHFKNYGYETLVVWEHEFSNINAVASKITNFVNGGSQNVR